MSYLEDIVAMHRSLVTSKKAKLQNLLALPAGEPEQAVVEAHRASLDPSFVDFYRQLKSYELKWESKPKVLPERIYGKVRFLEASKALSDWRDVVYFADDSPLRDFRVLDHMVSEACCGFFTTDTKVFASSLIYYLELSGEPVSLGLTIDGYVQMVLAAKGFVYWQKALLDRAQGIESPHVVSMKRDLPTVFGDFDFEAFGAKYDALKK